MKKFKIVHLDGLKSASLDKSLQKNAQKETKVI